MTILRQVMGYILPARMVLALLAVNLAVFAYQQTLPGSVELLFARQHGAVPRAFFDPAWAIADGLPPGSYTTFLTASFLHHGWAHFLLNMVTLTVFGPAVEARIGHLPMLLLYAGCAVAASAAHVYFNANSQLPVLGASGAIAGLVSAFAATAPRARSAAALLLATAWFAVQVRHGVTELYTPNAEDGGVAWWAHIGGFLAGLALLVVLAPFRPRNVLGNAAGPVTPPPEMRAHQDWDRGPWG
jgi:membrane associated rhomboid family serine protease